MLLCTCRARSLVAWGLTLLLPQSYLFAVRMAEITPTAALIRRVRHTKTTSYETCLARGTHFTSGALLLTEGCTVLQHFDPETGIISLSLSLSLRDPLMCTRIDTPVRSAFCKHVQVLGMSMAYCSQLNDALVFAQCFDLEPYLLMNQNHPKFLCPVCNKSAPFNDLVVDTYFERILQQAPRNADSVDVSPDGSWTPVLVKRRSLGGGGGGTLSERPHLCAVVTNDAGMRTPTGSDDEDSGSDGEDPRPLKRGRTEPLSTALGSPAPAPRNAPAVIVDLT